MSDVTRFTYYLPLTCIRLQATAARSWVVDWSAHAMLPVVTHDTTVTTSATADVRHRGRQVLCLETRQLHDTVLKMEYYGDGRLKALNATQTERLGDVIGAAAKLVGTAVGAVTGVATHGASMIPSLREEPAAEGAQPQAEEPDSRYKRWSDAFPEHARRGEQLHAALTKIDDELEEQAQQLAANKASSDTAKAWGDARTVRDKLATDLAAIEQAAGSWVETQETALPSMDRQLSLDDVMVQRSQADQPPRPLAENLDQPPEPRFQSELDGIHMTVLLSIAGDSAGGADSDQNPTNDVVVRLPRPAMVGLYVRTESCWVLAAQARVNVVDEHSTLIHVPIEPKNLGNSEVSISLNEDGTPDSFGISKGSSLAAVAGGVNSALAGFQAGTDSAATVFGNLQKAQAAVSAIHSAPMQARIDQLQQEKRLIDAKIAIASAASTAGLIQQKNFLQAQLDNLLLEQKVREATN